MQALRFHEFGDPSAVLQFEEVPTPEYGPSQVLVRLTARSVNPSDLYTIMGTYAVKPLLPAVPGNEAAGVVEAVGSAVQGFKPGDRVTLMLGAVGTDGTWREFAAVDPQWLIRTPASLSDAQATSIWVNYITAWAMALEELELQQDEPVLVTACASHLGRAMIQLAQKFGFKVIGTVRHADQKQELLDLGAAGVIVQGEQPIHEAWHALTGKRGITKVLDAVAGDLASEIIPHMAPRGTFISYGLMSQQPFQVDGSLIFSEATIRGFWLMRWLQSRSPEHVGGVIHKLTEFLADGTFDPHVDSTFDLGDYKAMLERVDTPGRHGKVVLTSPEK